MTPLHPTPAPTGPRHPSGPSIPRGPAPGRVTTSGPRPDPHRHFLGEDLSPDPLEGSAWLVKAVLVGGPRQALGEDGVLPARPTGLLPLRHGLSVTGAPATCLLQPPSLVRLRASAALGADEAAVECAACRAWQATHRGPRSRPAASAVLARLRAVLGDVFSRAA